MTTPTAPLRTAPPTPGTTIPLGEGTLRRRVLWVVILILIVLAGAAATVVALRGRGTATSTGHVARAGEPALIQGVGYGYSDSVVAEWKSFASDMASAEAAVYKGYSVHAVTLNGKPIADLMLFALRPGVLSASEREVALDRFVGEMAGEASVSTRVVQTEQVVVATRPDAGTMYVWIHNDTLTFVIPEATDSTVSGFVIAYLTAAHAVI
ncbi:MAG: hypothetical protein ACXVPP_11095 [Actinomycetota bacterium]